MKRARPQRISPNDDKTPRSDRALWNRDRKVNQRIARPWMALGFGAAILVGAEHVVGRLWALSGARFDQLVDFSLVSFLSVGLIWAPMWSMRSARILWRGLSLQQRRSIARQVLVQGALGAPAIWSTASWLTRDIEGGSLLVASAFGSALISLGASLSLWMKTRG
ncbi:MAG TPA: hypothetical protein DCQ06_00980 [Myxococcales bacterium]|nr:hypothetical protein [Myxococcales bacterium]HAN30146.1 hypothetical protein [Myxococcales bacterium]